MRVSESAVALLVERPNRSHQNLQSKIWHILNQCKVFGQNFKPLEIQGFELLFTKGTLVSAEI